MAKFQDTLIKYEKEFEKLGITFDPHLFRRVVKGCGPSIYKKDASIVSTSSRDELERVKQNFLIKKLGLKDSPKLDEAINEVVELMGKGNRNKYRAVFYYLLVKKMKKSSVYEDQQIEKINQQENGISLVKHFDKIIKDDTGLLKRLAK